MYASMDGPKIAAQGNAYIHVDLDVSVMYVTSAANIYTIPLYMIGRTVFSEKKSRPLYNTLSAGICWHVDCTSLLLCWK